jgi:DNA-binding Lrp family transcriptional regulator
MTPNLPSNGPTKKERIHELISDGRYTDEEIAKIVHTTIANVWKEKSTLRKSGVLVRHRVERSDRTLLVTSAAQGVYATPKKTASLEYQELLNIPPVDSEGMKKLYTNIIEGKKPNEIIAAHGFHPAVVETEYHRSQKLHHDMLCKRIISEVLVLKTSIKGNALIDKYNEQGWISDDDFIELLKEYMQTMYLHGMEVRTPGYSSFY